MRTILHYLGPRSPWGVMVAGLLAGLLSGGLAALLLIGLPVLILIAIVGP